MRIKIITVGKPEKSQYRELSQLYQQRIKQTMPIELLSTKDIGGKRRRPQEIMRQEAELLAEKINQQDFLIIMDQPGKSMTSIQFAEFISQKQMNDKV